MRYIYRFLILLVLSPLAISAAPNQDQTTVTVHTNLGAIQLALFNQQTPKTVANFIQYIEDGFYQNTLFHRVTPSLIQGGLYDTKYRKKMANYPPIENEAQFSSHNVIGTVAMMRGRDPHSATTQFFINIADNHQRLDYASSTLQGWGYVVFGQVIQGMDIVEKIQQVKTGAAGGLKKYAPQPMVVIKSIDINHQADIPESPTKTMKTAASVPQTMPIEIEVAPVQAKKTPAINTSEQLPWSPEPPDVPAVE